LSEFDPGLRLEEPQLSHGLRLMEGIIGGRWNPMILFAMEQGARSYTDIRKSIAFISDTELQRKLNSLIESRLIMKENTPDEPRKTEYLLTGYGKDITHILHHIMDLSIKHSQISNHIP
jgi:DNA-binding HxlR family transcriptional regulator